MVVMLVVVTAVLVDDVDAVFGSHVDGNVGHFMWLRIFVEDEVAWLKPVLRGGEIIALCVLPVYSANNFSSVGID